MRTQRIHCLNFQQQAGRILKRILDRDQEGNRVGAIDDSMVVRQRQVHHGAYDNISIERHGPVLYLMHSQDGALWWIQDGR